MPAMAHFATFRVLVPAMSTATATGAAVYDPAPVHVGPASTPCRDGARIIGQALVTCGAGSDVPARGCSYITPRFMIPGYGVVSDH
jgi:hypothetical protein